MEFAPLIGSLGAGALLGLAFIPHCAGMCGPLALYACGGCERDGRTLKSGALYQLGRSVGYALLGALAGRLGAFLLEPLSAAWLGAVASWSVAIAMLAAAYGLLRRARAEAAPEVPEQALLRTAKERRGDGGRSPRPLLLGLMSAILPCGALFSGVVAAATSASPIRGALLMLGFAVATAPGLFALVWLARRVTSLFHGRRARIGAALLALGALIFVARPIPSLLEPAAPAACHVEAP